MSCWIFSLETTDASSKLCPNYMSWTFRQTDRHCYFLVIPTVAGVLTKKTTCTRAHPSSSTDLSIVIV